MDAPAYELWDLVSGNLVGVFPDRKDALAVVKETVDRYGRDHVIGTALVEVQVSGEGAVIAEDDELIQMASDVVASARI